MQLREARLCLDCEELHTDDRCPVCASDAFAFVTRWVPPTERKSRPRRPPPPPSRRLRWMTGGATGLALLATARWLSRPNAVSTPQSHEHVDGVVGRQPDDQRGQDQGAPADAEG
jgi:hypothetical protein